MLFKAQLAKSLEVQKQELQEEIQEQLQFPDGAADLLGETISPELVNVSYTDDGTYKIEVGISLVLPNFSY